MRHRTFGETCPRSAAAADAGSDCALAGSTLHRVANPTPTTLYILFYEYGENAAERRVPYRAEHLGLANASHADGQMVLAGAFADPLDGAALVFRTREAAEAFVKVDPYVASGLVTSWRVREWTVVVGGD